MVARLQEEIVGSVADEPDYRSMSHGAEPVPSFRIREKRAKTNNLVGSLAALLVASFLALPTSADEKLVPLLDYLRQPADRIVATYPMTRCAGLYLGVMDYAGKKFSEDFQAETRRNAKHLALAVVAIRLANDEGEASSLADFTMETINRVSEIYVRRFKGNYAVRGEAWVGDTLAESDIQTCRGITDLVRERYPHLRPSD